MKIGISKILGILKKSVLIDKDTGEYIILSPKKIQINDGFPYEKEGIFWRKKMKTKYGYKVQKMKSDNISWIAECEMYKVSNL